MSIAGRVTDTVYTYRFLRLLTTDWTDLDAYELGIIDENGEALKRSRELRTREEKSAYSLFHRLVFSIKRLLERFPGGRTVVGRYSAALFLIREYTGMSDDQLGIALDMIGINSSELQLDECLDEGPWFILEDTSISPGIYQLNNEAISPITGEIVGHPGDRIIVDEGCKPIGTVLESNIYSVRHSVNQQKIYISSRDIKR